MSLAQVRDTIIKARQAYYYGGNPIMSDGEYDYWENKLKELSPDDPLLSQVGAPVPPDHILEKAQHSMYMGSLDKVNSAQEFVEWANKHGIGAFHLSYKADGGSAAAYYTNGYITQVISRGDGEVGEDITANAIKFKGLPAYLEHDGKPFTGAVRFEAVLTKEDWKKIGGKNPRNMGNGIIGRKDGLYAEYITAYAFDIENDIKPPTETEKSILMMNMNLNVLPWTYCSSAEKAIDWYNQLMAVRGPSNDGSLPFWIDGVVVKCDDIQHQESLGMSSGRKKGQIAWKPASEYATTVLRDYEITGGHTGALIPNARLEPVDIGGTTVSRALLNNWDEIERLGVALGDTVKVMKANDIIPKIVEVVKRPHDRQPIDEPTVCPFCGGAVSRKATQSGVGANTVCTNSECPAKQDGRLKGWIKKVGILGIGDAVRHALREQLGIMTPADLYKLGAEIETDKIREVTLGEDSRVGRNAEEIVKQIDAKRALPLNVFLGSLGIEGMGRREVELACQKAPDELSTLADWRSGKLRNHDIQAKINAFSKADKWADGLDVMSDLIDELLKYVTVLDVAPESEHSATVCITGTLPSGAKKGDYAEPLKKAGFFLVDKVTKDLGYLVVADPNGNSNKMRKAKDYNSKGGNIAIISEDELKTMVGI